MLDQGPRLACRTNTEYCNSTVNCALSLTPDEVDAPSCLHDSVLPSLLRIHAAVLLAAVCHILHGHRLMARMMQHGSAIGAAAPSSCIDRLAGHMCDAQLAGLSRRRR